MNQENFSQKPSFQNKEKPPEKEALVLGRSRLGSSVLKTASKEASTTSKGQEPNNEEDKN